MNKPSFLRTCFRYVQITFPLSLKFLIIYISPQKVHLESRI
jgi:hypothetical protein